MKRWFYRLNEPRIAPLILTRLREPFDHPDWIFELKHDGFRGVAYVSDGRCQLVSRNGQAFRRLNPFCENLAQLRVKNAILDGEIICVDSRSHFTASAGRGSACARR